jgi:ATP-dependent exoDNAse (exonuclease V) beta subunit
MSATRASVASTWKRNITMTRIAIDQAARDRALDIAQSFIVQAPAGSGKTELLTQRYLHLLAHVEAPEEVLAITFTNKAAAEMRARVLKALQLAAGPEPEAPHERNTWRHARAVLARDGERGWALQRNPTRLRIQTIDSLCATLTRQMPLLSRFGAQPAIADSAEPLYREAARSVLNEINHSGDWSRAVAHVLDHLDNDHLKAENLLVTMLARRDQWLRHIVAADAGLQRRAQLETALAHAIEDALAQLRATAPPDIEPELCSLADYAASNLDDPQHPISRCRGVTALPGATAGALAIWRGIAALLLTQQGEWRKTVNAGSGFPAASGTKNVDAKARFDGAKERFKILVDRLQGADEFRLRLHAARELPPAAYRDDQWDVLQSIVTLLPLAVAHLRVVFSQRGEVDFVEIAQAALQALGTADAPTDLALALDYRIRHILVDEFQDTSQSQFALLERLTAGWEPGDGRTVFLVGDPMQSIYRFREGDVGLYLQARNEGIGDIRLEALVLSVNFRSHQGIVDWINATFARVLPGAEDIAAGAVSYVPSVAHRDHHPHQAVSIHPGLNKQPAVEAAQVLALVAQAQAVDPEGSIAILVRSRTHLLDIVPALKRVGLKFRAIEIEPLQSRQVVQDLLALTRALAHPADRIAWLAVLRAPWCGATLDDLERLLGDAPERTVWDAINDDARLARLSQHGCGRIAHLRDIVGVAWAQRGRARLRRWVEGVWLALGGPACVDDETDLADTGVFFEALEELDDSGALRDFAALEQRIEKLFALPDIEATDRLRIMTIHKAKGLEFDTVILPGLGNQPASDEPRLLTWLERPRGSHAAELLLAPLHRAGSDADPIYRYINVLESQRARHEDGRLLYVAVTRARKRLHLLGHTGVARGGEAPAPRAPHGASLLSHLWPVVVADYVAFAAAEGEVASDDDGDVEPALPQGIFRLPAEWRAPALPPAVAWQAPVADATNSVEAVEFEWAGESARHVGTVVHRFLEHIGTQGLANWDRARVATLVPAYRVQLKELGVPAADADALAERVQQALNACLDDPRGRWLFDTAHMEARSEYALSGVARERVVRVVMDRTFVDADGVRWIVDFKTSTHSGGGVDVFLDREQERYQNQLAQYARLMRQRDQRPIRLGLYFPLLQGWREWPDAGGNGR